MACILTTHKRYILAIDPGSSESAYAWYDVDNHLLPDKAKVTNEEMLEVIKRYAWREDTYLVIEKVVYFGAGMGGTLLDTCFWSGRFAQLWGKDYKLMARKTIVTALCRDPRAGDKHVRSYIIDNFGGPVMGVGTSKSPGPLHRVSKDVWSAIAVALAFKTLHIFDRSDIFS